MVVVLGQAVVDDPEGLFGLQRTTTQAGLLVSGVVVVLAAFAVWSRLRARRAWGTLAFLQLAVSVSAFVAPFATDPRVAGGVAAWQLWTASRLMFAVSIAVPRRRRADEVGRWLDRSGGAMRHLAWLATALAFAVGGFRVATSVVALALVTAFAGLVLAGAWPVWGRWWGHGARVRPLLVFVLVLLALTAFAVGWSEAAVSLCGLATLLVAASLSLEDSSTTSEIVSAFATRPALLVVTSFVLLIVVGTAFLSLPAAAAGSQPIGLTDALFTATSAVCVTGLIVLDTPKDFSTFGHVVILVLIQVGGLNIMVLSTFGALLLGRSLGLRGEQAMARTLEVGGHAAVYPLIRFIIGLTLAVELVGTLLLMPTYLERGESWGSALWLGAFHSISAFCNAGFALHSDSLISFRGDPWTLGVIGFLVTIGGLGFSVLAGVWHRLARRSERSGLEIHARLVLVTSAALVVGGTVWFAAAEWTRSLAGLSVVDKLSNALFQSVTLRTAGFNSVDFSALAPATVLLMLVWMFVGASPGGTGGGVKTTTAAVLFSALPAIARGRHRLVLMQREIALDTVYRSAALVVISATTVVLATGMLLALGGLDFESAIFEVVSALGTVGLSIGATAKLDAIGKVLIALVMFLGRIGPLTLAFLLARGGRERLRYPEARVMVG